MRGRLNYVTGATLACVLLLGGCGGVKLWPFGSDSVEERSRIPANATEYRCSAGKGFYVRALEGGSSVWLILPEREMRLDRLATGSGTRYSNGIAVLEINGGEASFADGSAAAFADCKAAPGKQ